MLIFFITTQKDVISLLAKRLEELGHSVRVFTDSERMFDALKVSASAGSEISLLGWDCLSVRIDIVNPYEMMEKMGLKIPTFFYNSPFPGDSSRPFYWAEKIRKNQSYVPQEKIDGLLPVLSEVASFVSARKKNIALLAPPAPLESHADSLSFNADDFVSKVHLPSSRMKLFRLLCSKAGDPVSEDEICAELWGASGERHVRTLYTYIHDIRKAFIEYEGVSQGNFFLDIEQDRDRRYFLSVKSVPHFLDAYSGAEDVIVKSQPLSLADMKFTLAEADESYIRKFSHLSPVSANEL